MAAICSVPHDQLVDLFSGEKTIEIRVLKGVWEKVKVGDEICFGEVQVAAERHAAVAATEDLRLSIPHACFKVVKIEIFDTFGEALKAVGVSKVLPRMKLEEAIAYYKTIYPADSWFKRLGFKVAAYHLGAC
jgi:ASC-1-like (ASCH) protein